MSSCCVACCHEKDTLAIIDIIVAGRQEELAAARKERRQVFDLENNTIARRYSLYEMIRRIEISTRVAHMRGDDAALTECAECRLEVDSLMELTNDILNQTSQQGALVDSKIKWLEADLKLHAAAPSIVSVNHRHTC
jgi:hypothetical protein